MTVNIDKTFVIVLIVSLLFGNLIYMWGKHKGAEEVISNNNYIEILRTQINQVQTNLRKEQSWKKK